MKQKEYMNLVIVHETKAIEEKRVKKAVSSYHKITIITYYNELQVT